MLLPRLVLAGINAKDGVARRLLVTLWIALAYAVDCACYAHAASYMAIDGMFAPAMGRRFTRDKKLGTLDVGPGIGHTSDSPAVVLEGVVCTVEEVARASGAGGVATLHLCHETPDHTLSSGTVVDAFACQVPRLTYVLVKLHVILPSRSPVPLPPHRFYRKAGIATQPEACRG